MTPELMSERIVQFVNERGGALLHEIVTDVNGEGTGTLALNENVILWDHVSPTFVKAFNLAMPRLEIHRANPGAYAFFSEEGIPGLPVLSQESWNKQEFSNPDWIKPRWLPLVFFPKKEVMNEESTLDNPNVLDSDLHPDAAVNDNVGATEKCPDPATPTDRSGVHSVDIPAQRSGELPEEMPDIYGNEEADDNDDYTDVLENTNNRLHQD